MPEDLSTMKKKNTWWTRSIAKESARLTNKPKPFKGDRFSVPTDFANFAPKRTRNAPHHKY